MKIFRTREQKNKGTSQLNFCSFVLLFICFNAPLNQLIYEFFNLSKYVCNINMAATASSAEHFLIRPLPKLLAILLVSLSSSTSTGKSIFFLSQSIKAKTSRICLLPESFK